MTPHQPPDVHSRIYTCIVLRAILLGCAEERVVDRAEYGELRTSAIGLADGLHLSVVYTDRPGTRDTIRRTISARRSNRRERNAYDQAYDEEA